MRNKLIKYALIAALLALGVIFVAKNFGSEVLKSYVTYTIGGCDKNPLLCARPSQVLDTSAFICPDSADFLPYRFDKVSIKVPKGFKVVNEKVIKVYYKRRASRYNEAAVYIFSQQPGFFVDLFPQLKKGLVVSDYDFISRVMNADLNRTANVDDVFFVITKSIFIPCMGSQKNLKITSFERGGRKGFIVYNMDPGDNYFDCDFVDRNLSFYKIYIRDKGARLDLNDVFAIIDSATVIDASDSQD